MGVRGRVLVVDDDRDIQEVLALVLRDSGYAVTSVDSGVAALDTLRHDRRGWVVLLDWMMPGLDGEETLQEVERDATLHCCNAFVLMTAGGRTLPLPLVRLLGRLDVGYLAKPFELDGLLDIVDHARERVARAIENCNCGNKSPV